MSLRLEVGEVMGMLNVKVKDELKKVNLSILDPDTICEYNGKLTTIHFDNDRDAVILSNKNNDVAHTVKSLIFNLHSHYSNDKISVEIYDDKSKESLSYVSLSRFSDITIEEFDDRVDIVIHKVENQEVN